MNFDVSAAVLSPGEVFQFSKNFEFDHERSVFVGTQIAPSVTVVGSYMFSGGKVNVEAAVCFKVVAECSRCLKRVEKDIEFGFSEKFAAEDEEAYPLNDKRIDLSEAVYQNVILNMPQRYLCKDDCRGICPVCGADLNQKQCDCKIEETSVNAFSVLNDLN